MDSLLQALKAVSRVSDDLFATSFDDDMEVVFRLPSIKQAEQYARLLDMAHDYSDQVAIYDYIFRQSVEDSWLSKKDGEISAGIVESISKLILFLSGYHQTKAIEYTNQMIQYNRQLIQNPTSVMKSVICRAFPGYTFEALDKLNYHQLLYDFTQAEKALIEDGRLTGQYVFGIPGEPKKKKSNVPEGLVDEMVAREFQKKQKDPRMEKVKELLREKAIREEKAYYKKAKKKS